MTERLFDKKPSECSSFVSQIIIVFKLLLLLLFLLIIRFKTKTKSMALFIIAVASGCILGLMIYLSIYLLKKSSILNDISHSFTYPLSCVVSILLYSIYPSFFIDKYLRIEIAENFPFRVDSEQ